MFYYMDNMDNVAVSAWFSGNTLGSDVQGLNYLGKCFRAIF